jgi:uncharacterized protein with PIN domain
MSNSNTDDMCDFCRAGRLTRKSEEIVFHQWTEKGYLSCRATVPVSICDHCGSKTWNEAAEKAIEEAVAEEYRKLP